MRFSVQKLRAMARLSAREQLLVVAAALLRMSLALVVHALPYRLWSWLFRSAVRPAGAQARRRTPRPDVAAAVALAVERSSGAGGGECLERALTGFLLLRALGRQSTVRIGLGRREGHLIAHAWLEHDGEVVLNGPVDGLVPLPEPAIPGAEAMSLILKR